MSLLQRKDLHAPLNSLAIKKLLGHLFSLESQQQAAANVVLAKGLIGTFNGDVSVATSVFSPTLTTQPFYIQDIYAMTNVVPGTGESITYDVQVFKPGGAFATVLSAPFVFGTTQPSAGSQVSFSPAQGIFIPAGSYFSVVRSAYTTGGSPTMNAATASNLVVIELSP